MRIFLNKMAASAAVMALVTQGHLAFAQNKMTQASNDFAAKMLQNIAAQKPNENIVLSPTSLSTAFSVVMSAAPKHQQAVALKALGYDSASMIEVLQDNQKFEASLVKDTGYKVSSKNAIYSVLPFEEKYQSTVKKYSNAETGVLDFAKPGSSKTINTWAENSTNKLISEIVEDEEIKELTFLGLNATVLEAKWAGGKFDSPSYKAPFLGEDGEEIGKVELMMSNPSISIAQKEYENFTVYEVPYEFDSRGTPKGSMMVLLPKILNQKNVEEAMWTDKKVKPQIVPLSEVLASLNGEKIAQMNDDLQSQRVAKEVYRILFNIPKFKVETTLGEELKTLITDFGGASILSGLDLSSMISVAGMSPEAGEAQKNLWKSMKLKLIKQKAVIEVAEEGTKAAAVSAIGGFPESCPPPSIDVNRPFAYLIKDGATGRIVFAGTYVTPN